MKNKNRSIAIIGTGTDVGKSYLSASVVHLAQKNQFQTSYFKPLQCGGDPSLPFPGGDAQRLESLGVQCPSYTGQFLQTPCSPHLALRKENAYFSLEECLNTYQNIRSQNDLCVIELAGGIRVPIAKNFEMVDLLAQFNSPNLLISSPLLGTLNHTLLTVESLEKRNLLPEGFLFSRPQVNFNDLEMEILLDSAIELEIRTGIPFLGVLPFISESIAQYKDWDHHPLNIWLQNFLHTEEI